MVEYIHTTVVHVGPPLRHRTTTATEMIYSTNSVQVCRQPKRGLSQGAGR